MQKKRSVGVTIFGILLIIWGICGFTGTILLVQYFQLTGIGVNLIKPYLILGSLFYIPTLISGIGALLLANWARRLIICLNVLLFGSSVFLIIGWVRGVVYVVTHSNINFVRGQIVDGMLWFLHLGWSIILVWFFMRPSVKEQFQITLPK